MTVAQLIKELNLLPKTAKVFTASVDHSEYEVDYAVSDVNICYRDDAIFDPTCYQDSTKMPEKWVTLIP